MVILTNDLQKDKANNDFEQFYKKLDGFIPELKKFINGSIKNSEKQRQLDIGYYKVDEVLDEVYLKAFTTFSNESNEAKLKRWLFKLAVTILKEKKSNEIIDYSNTSTLLKEELKTLSEEFTTEGDGDRILFEELDDISYQQKQGWTLEYKIDESLEKLLVEKFNLKEAALLSEEKRKELGMLYHTIPEKSKTVVELLVFGDQNTNEIAQILGVPELLVKKIIVKVKERFSLL